MKTIKEILDWCENTEKTATLKQHLPKMVDSFNKSSDDISLHYAYHEDGSDTWVYGWRESEYKPEFDEETQDCIKIFEYTWLIGKKKPTARFQKASTYTAECAIFLFKVAPANAEYRIQKSIPNWIKNFKRAKEIIQKEKETLKAWNSYDKSLQEKLLNLKKELNQIFGKPHSRERRGQIEAELYKYGIPPNPRQPWQKWIDKAAGFENVEDYIKFMSEKLKNDLKHSINK